MLGSLKSKGPSHAFSARNILVVCLMLSIALLFFAPFTPTAHAQATSTTQAGSGATGPGNCGWWSLDMTCIVTELVQWGTNLIVTFMAFIGGLFIAIEVWFIDVMLQINNNVTQQVLVQTGFSVTLALANLGFVLGIIVIALATILRNQTYGIKQILWKLVVAAILVNFSLVICGVIINFANTLTNYFMAPLGDATGFASSIGSVFQPQQFFTPQAGGAGGGVSTNSINSLFGAAGDSIGGILAPIITILTALIFIVAIVIVLATFFLMLLVRYIYLAFLLIFMPLAWVSWVFPMFKQHWSRWWSTFLRWTFFPPLVVFFLYLVIQTGNAITAKTANSPLAGANVSTTNFTTTANGVVGAISSFFGNVFTSILTTALNDVLLIGLAVGGLIAANSMSIKFADAGMKAFGKAKDGILGYANNVRRKGQRALIQKSGQVKQGLQEGRYFRGKAKGLQGIAGKATPDLQKLKENLQSGEGKSKYIPGVLRRPLGEALESAERAGGGALVAENRKKAAEMVERDPQAAARTLQNVAGSKVAGRAISTQEQVALLEQTTKNPDFLKAVRNGGIEGMGFAEWVQKNEQRLKDYHVDKDTIEKLQDKSGLTYSQKSEENKVLGPQVQALESVGKTKEEISRETALELKKASAGPGGLTAEQEREFASTNADIADLEGKKSRGLTDYEKKRFSELTARKEELERAKKGGFTDAEEKELQGLKSRRALTEDEERELTEARTKLKENNRKIAEVTSKDPELAGEFFQDQEAARTKFQKENPGKPLPLTLDPKSVELIRGGILKAMIQGFSPYNMRALVDAIAKKNNLGHLESAVGGMVKEIGKDQVDAILSGNKELKRWMQNNSALGIIDWVDILKLPKTKGYKKQLEKGSALDEDEET